MPDAPQLLLPLPFPIHEIAQGWVLHEEQMGSKDKHWVDLPGDDQPWLFKLSRESAETVTGEHWAEKVAAEVAELLGVPHARVELAKLDGKWGAICRRFDELGPTSLELSRTELVHGNDLLAGHVMGYDPTKKIKQSDHTLGNILSAVDALFDRGAKRDLALKTLAGFLILDGLILNTDRHHENWGMLRLTTQRGVLHCVAPNFDHASSLGRNEPVERVTAWLEDRTMDRAAWYATRSACRGGVYEQNNQPHGANPLTLVIGAAQQWPRFFEDWKPSLVALTPGQIQDVLDRVPEDAMAQSSKRFALALMTYTLGRLQNSLL